MGRNHKNRIVSEVDPIEPIPPTEEEVILRPYGGKRSRKENPKDEEEKENE